jgi:ABC-type transport system involved in cytochrome c biogenesis permease component
MQFLPIVERELRVAARQSRTWWRRVLTLGVALVLFTFVLLVVGRWSSLNLVGRELFSGLSVVGTIYTLLAGPLTTADCLSRERREGTLGLLFLTDLRSYDVVLGKMAAASLYIALDLTAALPVVAIPILMGGVSLGQLTFVALALVNIMFLSLAVGTCASALCSSGRAALAVTLAVLLFLTLGLMFLGEEVLGIRMGTSAASWFYMLCPAYAMQCCLGGMSTAPRWDYWLNMGGMLALGWVCLVIASRRTTTSWRDLPASVRVLRWQERFEQWRKGSAASRLAWRLSMLNKNPVSWLEGRDRLQERMLWGILLVAALLGAATHLLFPDQWPDPDWLFLWPMFAHYVLCLWIAIQAPRRLADDKGSGALELLLCAPVTPAAVVQGCMLVLWRRFGRALLALLVLDGLLGFAYFSAHEAMWLQPQSSPAREMLAFALCALVVAPLQTYSLARIGLYEGLVQATSLRASFMVAWKVGLLPWLVWMTFMLSLEAIRRCLPSPFRITDEFAFAAWASVHLLVCGVFLAHANRQLNHNFRALAAQSARPVWWKRWLRLRPQLAG